MTALLSIELVYRLIGVILLLQVVMTLRDRGNRKRLTTALFWFLFACTFLVDLAPASVVDPSLIHRTVGLMVIVMAAIAGLGGLGLGRYDEPGVEARRAAAKRLGNRVLLPALAIPVVTVVCTLGLKGVAVDGVALLDQKNLTLAALAVATVLALLLAWSLTGGTPLQAVRESRRLTDTIGWAVVLPQMLAMLGGVFVAAGTGEAIQHLVTLVVPAGSPFLLVALYCVGMALFTMIMGNAFAAFPVMTAGIAVPFLIRGHGADPAPLVAIGMYAGYCGTLMTPMAANFNIVPAALLELRDRYQVIKVQIPTALPLLAANIVLMYFLAFRGGAR